VKTTYSTLNEVWDKYKVSNDSSIKSNSESAGNEHKKFQNSASQPKNNNLLITGKKYILWYIWKKIESLINLEQVPLREHYKGIYVI